MKSEFAPSMTFQAQIVPEMVIRAVDAVFHDTGAPTNIDSANNIWLERDDRWNLYLTTRCGRRYDVPYLSGCFIPESKHRFGERAAAEAGVTKVGKTVVRRLVGEPTFSAYGERRDTGV